MVVAPHVLAPGLAWQPDRTVIRSGSGFIAPPVITPEGGYRKRCDRPADAVRPVKYAFGVETSPRRRSVSLGLEGLGPYAVPTDHALKVHEPDLKGCSVVVPRALINSNVENFLHAGYQEFQKPADGLICECELPAGRQMVYL